MNEQYLIARSGEQSGPYTLEQIQQMQAAGQLLPSDMAWTEGQTDWLPLSQIADCATPTPPPPPPSTPPSPSTGAAGTSKAGRNPVVWIVRAIVLLLLVISIVLFIFDYRAKGERQEAYETLDEMGLGSEVQLKKVREITGRDHTDKKEESGSATVTYSWRGGLRKHLLIIHYSGYSEKFGVGYIDELETR
tara:strand:- start:590 stop:1162 length:573 start_codon:yes stop_codon:yes gene_type:complete